MSDATPVMRYLSSDADHKQHDSTTDTNRRRFLQRASAAGTGAGILGSATQPAAAHAGYYGEYGYTWNWTDCDGDDYPESYGIANGDDFKYADDVTIVAAGWRNYPSEQEEKWHKAAHHLYNEGYRGRVIGWGYRSWCGSGWTCWSWAAATERARYSGLRLADFIYNYRGWIDNIRLLGHSLGTQVVLWALYYLDYYNRGRQVTSAHLMGAAIHDEWPDDNWHYIDDSSYWTVNYHNTTDDTLETAWRGCNSGYALGEVGSVNGGPCNFYDRNMTWRWEDEHGFDYYIAYCDDYIVHDMAKAVDYYYSRC